MVKTQYKVNVKTVKIRGTTQSKSIGLVKRGSQPWGKPALGYRSKCRTFSTGRTVIRRRPSNGIAGMSRNNIDCFIGGTGGWITFGEKLKKHMKRLGVTNEWLSEETGLSTKTIQRLRNHTTTHPELTQVIAVSLGLQLTYADSIDLIETAGYKLRRKFELEALYDYFLSHIDEIIKESSFSVVSFYNNKLIDLGHKPLTNLL